MVKDIKNAKGRRARWIMDLQQYDFMIKHRPGKQNSNADALSRIPEYSNEISCFMMMTEIASDSENSDDNESDWELDTNEVEIYREFDQPRSVEIIVDEEILPI